ncbi:hypothetical protein ACH82I_04025 [Brevibacterium sp. GP-SGM9]|uniref:hypothetical protein n=1 Tax=Brevibacterium sp. GP-SGM9 TaxID=3376990 RepID=UPI0039A64444
MSLPTLSHLGAALSALPDQRAVIDRDTGREWVERELSKSEYSENDLTPLEQIGRWLEGVWESLLGAALRGNSPWLLLLVVIVVAGIIALIVWRVRRVGLRRTRVPLAAFDPVVAVPEPEPWRRSAAAAAAAGDFRTAVVDQARAIFALLSLKQIVSLDSSSTASELSRTAGADLPEHASELRWVAEVFNELLFGEASDDAGSGDATTTQHRPDPASNTSYSRLLDLDRSLSALPAAHRHADDPSSRHREASVS